MKELKLSEVPGNAQISGSQTIYKYKPAGILKARIVPYGNRDALREELRGDALCMQPEMFRLLISIASQNRWNIAEMDVSGHNFRQMVG